MFIRQVDFLDQQVDILGITSRRVCVCVCQRKNANAKKATLLDLHFLAEGFVNVNCDVTNEPYSQAIQSEFSLVVKFGPEYNDDNESILVIPHGAYEVNVAQYIYELIVLALPQKRIHPGVEDGSLDSEILKTL